MHTKQYVLIGVLCFFATKVLYGQSMIISSGTNLIQSGGNMVLLGNWVNDGTFTPGSGTVIFAGTTESLSGTSLNTFNNLTVASGSHLSLLAAANVTVNGTLSNTGGNTGLVLKSTAIGSGSLIHSTAGIGATVERYMNPNRWHIISPGVSGQTVSGFVTNVANTVPTSGSNYGAMYYSESGGGWVYYTNPAAGNLSVGSGYLVRHTADNAVSIAGTLSALKVDISVTKNANGWTAIGNPFPCSIGVREDATTTQNFLDYNAAALDPSYAALYLWDEPATRVSGVSYYRIICNAAFTPNRPVLDQAYMQPGQGFLIKANAAGTVSFTTNMRIHQNSGDYFKAARASWPGINLIVSSTTKSSSTAITFHKNMTKGLDATYDIGLLGGDPSFQLYSRLVEDNGINFMLQCLPDRGFENTTIPIGLDCKEGGSITFSAEIVPLPAGCKAILEDRLLGTFTDLELQPAGYTTNVGTNSSGSGRFFLHTSSISTVSNARSVASVSIYTIEKRIFVKGMVPENTHASLYDPLGRLVKSFLLGSEELNILSVSELMSGVYTIKILNKNLWITQKVYLK